ncbi:exosortase B [Ideonella sp. DXS22W]|uniref:Exosortase B n=1 Tax=Pseudaquabacterium inlustre TaxID=2984192 RepID=A0ABU9CHA8_9BURK
MNADRPGGSVAPPGKPWEVLDRSSLATAGVLVAGWLAMFGPTYLWLADKVWATDEQGHGPIILVVSAWLLYRLWPKLAAISAPMRALTGNLLLVFGLLLYVVGRSQDVAIFEVGSQIVVLAALLIIFGGFSALRLAWFPLFFLLFMCPLPSDFVAWVTAPLKSAVSAVAANLLHWLGYPVGRSGVILNVGQYQLLVADACAGLNSLFTLEALGLLYLNLQRHDSLSRNLTLATLIVPISFAANVIRVCILVLITYHFGDEAGQGFLHGFSGMVLFLAALAMILSVDHGLEHLAKRGILK